MIGRRMHKRWMGKRWMGASRKAGRALLAAALLAAPLGLGACAVLDPSAPNLYTLTPSGAVDASVPRADWQLLVETPVASAGLDTPRIAVTRGVTALDYFADVSWADRAPNLLQGLIVQSFENSGRIVAVGRDTVGLRADFVLKLDLRDFQAEFVTPNAIFPDRVHVRIAAKLVAMPRRTIEAGETFEAIVPVQGRTFPDVVNAFNQALGTVEAGLVQWTLRNGSAVHRVGSGRTS